MNVNRRHLFIVAILCLILTILTVTVFFKMSVKMYKQEELVTILTIKKGKIIQPFTPLVQSDLEVKEVAKADVQNGSYAETAINKVIGRSAWLVMADGEPILDWKLIDEKKLVPKQNESRYEIPIQEFTPMTEIRRGDKVKVWVRYQSKDQESAEEQLGKPVFFKQTNNSVDFLFETQLVGVKGAAGQEIFSFQPPAPQTEAVAELIDNNEVEPGTDIQKRIQQTFRGQPSEIPNRLIFNWTDEQYKMFAEAQRFGDIQIGTNFDKTIYQTPGMVSVAKELTQK